MAERLARFQQGFDIYQRGSMDLHFDIDRRHSSKKYNFVRESFLLVEDVAKLSPNVGAKSEEFSVNPVHDGLDQITLAGILAVEELEQLEKKTKTCHRKRKESAVRFSPETSSSRFRPPPSLEQDILSRCLHDTPLAFFKTPSSASAWLASGAFHQRRLHPLFVPSPLLTRP